MQPLSVIRKVIHDIVSGESRRMCRVTRYNSAAIHRTENVAEHSWYISWICLRLFHLIKDVHHDKYKIDLGTLLSKSLLHDLPEMLTGDIPRPFKHFNSDIRNAIDRAETEIFTKYCNDNDIPKEVHHSTLSAKEGLDGEVVKLADVLCVIGYVAEEIQMGNRLIFSTCVELKTLLPKLEQELTIPVLKEVASLYTIYVSNNMQWPDNL